ncbi:MAG: DUF4836 family protein [Ferruginibacter sp.]
MRIKFLPTLLIAVSAILVLASCGKKTNTEGRYIPKEAVFVAHLNGASLNEKLPWDEVKNNAAFKLAYADTSLDAVAKTALDNPDNTGIDIKSDLLIYVVKDSAGGYAAFQGKIKDAAKFKSFYTSALKSAAASQKDGVEYLTKDRISVSWDKDKFIILTDLPEMNNLQELENRNPFDTSFAPLPVVSTRNTITTAGALYTLSEGNSLGKEERFSTLVHDKADMHFWMNAEALYKDMPGMAAMAMINLGKLYEDARMTASANFDNGQIKVDMKSYGGKEMTDIYKKYSGSSISSEMAESLPAKDVAVFFAMNFKPEGIKEFIKLAGMEGLINMATAFIGFGMDDFIKANKGDILLSISDFKADSSGKAKPNVLFAASIGDKASFDKLIAAGQKAGKDDSSMASEISYNKNDKYFVIGNNKANNDQFISGKAGSKPAFWDKIKSSPIAGYVNIQALMNAFQYEAKGDSLGLEALKASQEFWNDAVLSGGEFKDGGIVQHVEINLVDKNTNSLKQLNKYVDKLGVIAKKKKDTKKIVYHDVPAVADTTVSVTATP